MRLAALLCLVAIAATLPPLPPHRYQTVKGPTQGSGAAKLIERGNLTVATTNTFTWVYPPAVSPGDYWWNLETAPGVAGPWSVLVTNASGVVIVQAKVNETLRVYRLVGRIAP